MNCKINHGSSPGFWGAHSSTHITNISKSMVVFLKNISVNFLWSYASQLLILFISLVITTSPKYKCLPLTSAYPWCIYCHMWNVPCLALEGCSPASSSFPTAILCRWLLWLWATVLKGLGPKDKWHSTAMLFFSNLCKVPTVDWLIDWWFLNLKRVNSSLEICSINIIHSISPKLN